MGSTDLVTEQAVLDKHCQAWRQAGVFAFDTEFIRDDTYDAQLCLIQVTTDGDVVLVDPTADLDLGVFWDLVVDPDVVTVVHAGKEDFEVCYRTTGQVPRNVFDVQIAAGFVGYGYPLSLLRLVEFMVHKRIAKAQTLTDWLRRPLTEAQHRYAIEDVLYLPQTYRRLSSEIEQAGRSAWLAEELRQVERPEYYQPPTADRVQRLKGSSRLDGLGLVVLERLVDWRDEWAQRRNRPIRALMRDDVLVEIARRRPSKQSDLEVLRGFPQSRNRRVVAELLEVITEACKTPRSEWPKPAEHREETPMAKAMVDLLSAVTQAICYEERLSRNLLGGAQRLRDLLDYASGNGDQPERPALLCGWREEFVGQRLVELIEGRCELHLSGWPRRPRLRIASHGKRKRTHNTDQG